MIKLFRFLFKALLMITGIMSLFKCTQNNKSSDGKTKFHGKEIADKNFIIMNDNFAKDTVQVYYKSYTIEGADVQSFTPINDNYAKDKNQVYYCDEYRESQNYYLTKKPIISAISSADISSFEVLENGYAKDKNQAFFEGQPFKVQDIHTFEDINRFFSRDDQAVYYDTKRIEGCDGRSFELINEFYARDDNNYYFYGYPSSVISFPVQITTTTSPLEILEYPYSKNGESVFYQNKKIIGLDSKYVTVLGNGYAKDDHKVYYETHELNSADPVSFVINEQSREFYDSELFSWDKNSVFYETQKVKDADPTNFNILGIDYASDHKHVFYKTKIVKNVDISSFRIFDHGHGDEDAEDKNNKYSKGKKVTQ